MKKKMIILLQMVIAIVLIGTSVYAAVTATLDLEVSADKVKKGDTVSVTLTLKDVDSEKKVGSISGYINYDENVIEKITVDSIVKNEDNTVKIGNETLTVEDLTNRPINQVLDSSAYVGFNGDPSSENDSIVVIDFNGAIKEDTDLITINFKVKETATIGEVKNAIEYKMFVITSGTGEKSEEISKNVTLTITDVNVEDDDKNQANSANETNNNTVKNETNNNTVKNETNNNTVKNETNTNSSKNNTNTNKVNTTNKNTAGNTSNKNTTDNTIASIILPATGAKGVIIPAIILILCAYIFYNRYMKYKDI